MEVYYKPLDNFLYSPVNEKEVKKTIFALHSEAQDHLLCNSNAAELLSE